MHKLFTLAIVPGMLCFGATLQVDLSGVVDSDIRTYTSGTAYPVAPTTLNAAGVSFSISPFGPDSFGVMQGDSTSGATEFNLNSLSFPNATIVYTIINSAFGVSGANNGYLEFTGSGGATYQYDLIQGDNIRDHFNGFYVNTAPNAFATINFPSGARLDVQRIVLPVAFSTQMLTGIKFVGSNTGNFADGLAFVAAITITEETAKGGAIPEPSTFALIAIGGLAVAVRSRR
jgi:hypothetical protein